MSWLDNLKQLFFEEEKTISEPETKNDFKQITSNISQLLKKDYTYYLSLIPILLIGFWIRIQNLDLLRGKFLLGLDPYKYFRYATEILTTGGLSPIDIMRKAPIGHNQIFYLLPYFLAAWDKLVIAFGQTQMLAHILYPAAIGIIGLVFFFLFIKEIFNPRVSILATAFLAVMPAYLYRTLAGFADHEALAMMLMFAALWTFVLAYKSNKLNYKLISAAISGILTLLMALTWHGYAFLTIPISIFIISLILFNKTSRELTISYAIWLILFILPLLLIRGANSIFAMGILLPIFAAIALLFHTILLRTRIDFFTKYLPRGLQSIIITTVVGVGVLAVLKMDTIKFYFVQILQPAETSGRVAHTISEITGSTNLLSAYSWLLYLAFLGTLLLIYLIFKEDKKSALTFCGMSLFFFFPAMFKKYSLNTYLYLLIATGILAAIAYLYFYHTGKEDWLKNINILLVLPLSYLIVFTYLAKSAARFLFIFAPIIAIFAAYLLVKMAEEIINYQQGKFKGILIIVAIFTIFLFVSNAQAITRQAESAGSGLPGPWNQAFTWVRDNTPEDSIVTHWWDYGYWTQTIGERASTHDGGTHGEYVLYLLARYAMTHPNPSEALTYFKTYNVDYLLYSEEEIGKYHAFAYIGSNKDFDRRSTIGIFGLQQQQEVRNGTRLIYSGQWDLDEDYVLNNRVYSEGKSAIIGLTIDSQENSLSNPIAYLSDGKSTPTEVPIECVCFNGICEDNSIQTDFRGCIVIIPSFQSQTEGSELGAAFYLSKKVKDGLFARLYIKGEKLEGFEEVYSDDTPLALYQGRIIGPKKIWKINPSSYIEEDPALLWNNTEKYGYEKDFHNPPE